MTDKSGVKLTEWEERVCAGYGHVAPKTKWGRMITIVYALVGIPLTFLYLSNMGNFMAECFRLFYQKVSMKPTVTRRRSCDFQNYRFTP